MTKIIIHSGVSHFSTIGHSLFLYRKYCYLTKQTNSMKTLKLAELSVLALVLTVNMSVAQNYKAQFKVNSSGQVEDAAGVKIGWIEANGTIKNSKGEVVGKTAKKDKQTELLDKLGNKVAEATETGTLKNTKGEVLYTVSDSDKNGDCLIKDKSGKTVGIVHQNYKQQGACIYHCLAQMKKK
jgi:hypothetical protein